VMEGWNWPESFSGTRPTNAKNPAEEDRPWAAEWS
jgi:hypothetical protein